MDRCYFLVDVQEIRIQPYFCVKQGDYFFSLFLGHPVSGPIRMWSSMKITLHGHLDMDKQSENFNQN